MRIDDFKAALRGGGARPNLFRVDGQFPNVASGALATIGRSVFGEVGQDIGTVAGNLLGGGGPSRQIPFLARAASIPASTIGDIPISYRGRQIHIPGDRTFSPWSLTIINDTDFALRDAFEQWANLINSHEGNIGTQGLANVVQEWRVTQLGKGGESLKTYKFVDCWVSEVSDITLDFETSNSIETFTVTLQYSYWTSNSTT